MRSRVLSAARSGRECRITGFEASGALDGPDVWSGGPGEFVACRRDANRGPDGERVLRSAVATLHMAGRPCRRTRPRPVTSLKSRWHRAS